MESNNSNRYGQERKGFEGDMKINLFSETSSIPSSMAERHLKIKPDLKSLRAEAPELLFTKEENNTLELMFKTAPPFPASTFAYVHSPFGYIHTGTELTRAETRVRTTM